MKRKKGIKVYFKYCLIALMTIASIYACKKESQSELVDINDVQQLKTWFKNNIDHTSLNRFESMEPDWNDIHLTNDSTQTVYEVNLKNPKKVGQTQGEFDESKTNNYVSNNNIRLLIFKEKSTGNLTTGYYMSVINAGMPIALEDIHYKQVDKLDGTVLFYDAKGTFTNGWFYKGGKISRQISLGTIVEYLANEKIRKNNSTSNRTHGKIMLEDVGGTPPVQPVGSDGSVVCYTEGIPLFRTQCSGVDGYMNCQVVQYGIDYVQFCSPSDNGSGSGGGGGVGSPGSGPGTGGGGGGSAGSSPKIVISLDDRLNYPTLAKIIDGLYEKVKNNGKLMSAIKEFSHLTEAQILENLKTGQGPQLKVVDPSTLRGGSVGHYDNGTLLISSEVALDANYFSTQYPTAAELYLSVVILHEFIHFGEDTTNIFTLHNGHTDDAGFQFENKYYGGKIDWNKVSGEVILSPL